MSEQSYDINLLATGPNMSSFVDRFAFLWGLFQTFMKYIHFKIHFCESKKKDKWPEGFIMKKTRLEMNRYKTAKNRPI